MLDGHKASCAEINSNLGIERIRYLEWLNDNAHVPTHERADAYFNRGREGTTEGPDLSSVCIERVLPELPEDLPVKDRILRLMREDTAYEYQAAQFYAWKQFISTGEFPPSDMFWTKPTNIKREINETA